MTDLPSDGEKIRLFEGRLKSTLPTPRCRLCENADGAKISSFRAGGFLSLAAYPEDSETFLALLRIAKESGVPATVIGGGTNLVISDGIHEGVFLSTERFCRFSSEGETVFCEAGVRFSKLSSEMGKRGISLVEELSGIPGTVGGMIAVNASAFGRSIGEIVKTAEVYDRKTDKIHVYAREELAFSYRKSLLSEARFLLLSAILEGRFDSSQAIRMRRERFHALRAQSQPLGVPSLGCYFKRSGGRSPGEIIDSCGLKGLAVGGARVSEKHAAFLVNTGTATATDLLTLAALVKDTVRRKTGILLEEEVIRI